ncbi:MAG: hypothetical protein ACLPY2_22815 [Bryobacteraceae bacterium]|jgi:hypothetical protein
MFLVVLPYLILVVLVGSAAVLLTSKKLADKFVAAGILPRTFLGIIPILQSVIRIFGGVLVAAGVIKIGMDSGWIDAQLLSRYAFPGCLILLGVMLLLLNRRD